MTTQQQAFVSLVAIVGGGWVPLCVVG